MVLENGWYQFVSNVYPCIMKYATLCYGRGKNGNINGHVKCHGTLLAALFRYTSVCVVGQKTKAQTYTNQNIAQSCKPLNSDCEFTLHFTASAFFSKKKDILSCLMSQKQQYNVRK